jgi:hypothetical protein
MRAKVASERVARPARRAFRNLVRSKHYSLGVSVFYLHGNRARFLSSLCQYSGIPVPPDGQMKRFLDLERLAVLARSYEFTDRLIDFDDEPKLQTSKNDANDLYQLTTLRNRVLAASAIVHRPRSAITRVSCRLRCLDSAT